MPSKNLIERKHHNLPHDEIVHSSNFSTTNLAFVTVNLEDIEVFEDSPGANCADKPEVESRGVVIKKGYIFTNLQ